MSLITLGLFEDFHSEGGAEATAALTAATPRWFGQLERARQNFVALNQLAPLRLARVTLTDAQIKALPTTPIELVADPGASLRVVLLQAALRMNATAGAYTNINATAASIFINYAGDTSQWASVGIVDDSSASLTRLTSFLGAAAQRADLTPYLDVFGSGWAVPNLQAVANCEHKALVLSADNNGSGNFTGGNAANGLVVDVLYFVR